MARLGERARKRRIRDIALGVVVFALIVAIAGGTIYYNVSRPPPLNAQTLCPSAGPLGQYVLLVDTTDRLSDIQRQAFETTVREIVEKRTPEGFLLSVFVLGEDFRSTTAPVIELCNPGDGTGKSELTDNLLKLRQRYEQQFLSPMRQQLGALGATAPGKQSPIFEMLQLVGINGFRRHDVKGEKRLIVMSDMLHHTVQMSMYRQTPEFEEFAATDYGRKAQADLTGVDVELHYLINNPTVQTKRNMRFWELYLNRAGARLRSVRPLEG